MWSADWDCCKTSGRVSGLQAETATEVWTGYLVCRLRLLQNFRQGIWSADWVRLLQNFRQGIWSAGWDCYRTLDRVAGLQTEIATKLQAGYLVCRLRLLQPLGRVSALKTEITTELWTGYLVCRLRLLQNFRQGICSADWDCYKTSDRLAGLRTETAT